MTFIPNQHPFRAAAIFSSPLQIRNASQALAEYGIGVAECLKFFLPGINAENRVRCQRLLGTLGWNDAVVIDPPDVAENENQLEYDCQMLSSLAVIEWISKSLPGRLEHVFMGDYRPRLFVHIVNLLHARNTVILDDGSIVPEIADYRINYLNPLYTNPEIANHRKKVDLVSFPSKKLLLDEPESLEFFTIYRINLPLHDKVRRNLSARGTLDPGSLKREKRVWLIGTNHVEEGITSYGRYFAHLRKIIHHYRGTPVVYYAHRREQPQKLMEITKLLKIEVLNSEEGVEAEITTGRRLPSRIATIVSTVTDTIGDMSMGAYPVDCFVPDDGYLGARRREHIDAIVAYQRRNQHANTNFWRISEDGEGGHVDAETSGMVELNFMTTSPIVGLSNGQGCTWVDDEGIFARDISVELSADNGDVLELVVTDLSQPHLHEGDDYFLLDAGGGARGIRLERVSGLALTARVTGEAVREAVASDEARGKSSSHHSPWRRALKAAGAALEKVVGSSDSPDQAFTLRPKWRRATTGEGTSRLPAGLPLGTGTTYYPLHRVEMVGLDFESTGGRLEKLDGLLLDAWGKPTSGRFSELPRKGIHRLKFSVKEPLVEGEHLSFILQNGGRGGLCVRLFHQESGHVANCFLDLTFGASETVSLHDDFADLVGSIVVDRLHGNWLRLTIAGGPSAKQLVALEFVLQNKFMAGSSIYPGSEWRGLFLDRIARAFGKDPLLPTLTEGSSWKDAAADNPMGAKAVAEVNLQLSFVTDERRFVSIKLGGKLFTFDLRPQISVPSWLGQTNLVSVACQCLPETTATLNLHLSGGKIHACTTEGSVPVTEVGEKTFDFEIVDHLLGENVCPLLAGLEICKKPLGREERTRCIHRGKLVPSEIHKAALIEFKEDEELTGLLSPEEDGTEPGLAEEYPKDGLQEESPIPEPKHHE